MTVLRSRDVIRGLTKKGFQSVEGDHTHFILYVNGKKTSVRTKVSHGTREIDDFLISAMASQLKIDKKGFKEYIDCQKSQEDYINQLKRDGIVVV
jgi:predicted RNA binding protein YcfA (HicA-like mRNA interferase family)